MMVLSSESAKIRYLENELNKVKDNYSQLETQLGLYKQEVRELREIEFRRSPQEDFAKASHIQTPHKQIWISAINALKLFVALRKARDHAISNNEPWAKLIFDINPETGEIITTHLANDDHDNKQEKGTTT